MRRRRPQGRPVGHLPIIDLNKESTRGVLLGFVALSVPMIAIAAGLTFKAVHYMDSTEFCGMACHKVMQPEYTAFQRSPHVRVGCAGCHIGPGAEWFVKAKISGSWQLIAVAFDLYPRPIPTPVHSLRPASGTCEQCHWPTQVRRRAAQGPHALRGRRAEHRAQDRADGQGRRPAGGQVARHPLARRPEPQLRYLADPTREKIYEIELTDLTEGSKKIFKAEEPAPEGAEWRTMDCIDCHNRPSHIYRTPQYEVDLALEEGRIDRTLPFIKREGVRILTEKEYASHEAAREGIAAAIEAFYAANYPRPRQVAGGRAGRQGARRRLLLEQLPADEGDLEHLPEPHRAQGLPGLLPLPRQQAQDGRRREDRQEVRDLPRTSSPRKRATRSCCRNSACRSRRRSRRPREAPAEPVRGDLRPAAPQR